jgi:hypothetical protein
MNEARSYLGPASGMCDSAEIENIGSIPAAQRVETGTNPVHRLTPHPTLLKRSRTRELTRSRLLKELFVLETREIDAKTGEFEGCVCRSVRLGGWALNSSTTVSFSQTAHKSIGMRLMELHWSTGLFQEIQFIFMRESGEFCMSVLGIISTPGGG